MDITPGIIKHVRTYIGPRKGGHEAVFTPINRDWGFKHYTDKHRAMVCYARQKWAYQFGIAPQIGEFTKFGKFYGFTTERVRPISRQRYTDFDNMEWANKLRYIGYSCNLHFDFCIENSGLNKENKIVLLDWGWCEAVAKLENADIAKILSKHGYNIENYIKRYPI